MMSLLLLILSTAPFSYANILNATVIHGYAFEFSSSCTGRRSLWKIITSCSATLFAGAWTAIHPNMPGPVESGLSIGLRRLGIMMLALVSPEVVLAWAIRQLLDALSVQRQFQSALQEGTIELRVKFGSEPRLVSANVPRDTDEVVITIPEERTTRWPERWWVSCSSTIAVVRKPSSRLPKRLDQYSASAKTLQGYCRWTLKHSFYAWMGGFMLFINKEPTLSREVYHPLTPHELFEFLTADLVEMSMVSEKALDGRSKGDWLSKIIAIVQLAWFAVQLATRAFGKLPTTQLEINALAISILSCFTYAFWWYKPKDVRCYAPVYWKNQGESPEITYSVPQRMKEYLRPFGVKESWLGDHFGEMLRPLLNLGGIPSVSVASVKAHRVPCLCGYSPDVDRRSLRQNLPVYFIAALTGILFGGMHCIAWDFTFPTPIEQTLWRVTSVIMVVMPALALATVTYAYLTSDGAAVPHATAAAISMFTFHFLYVICRLTVISLTFLSLRSLPDGVYDEVCWPSIIPHW